MLASGHELETLTEDEMAVMRADFKGYKDPLVRLKPGRWLLCNPFKKFADKLYNFKWSSSDVMVMTYPKCGTTWTQEILWTMRNNPDLNHPNANDATTDRIPFLECDMFFPADIPKDSPLLASCPSFSKLCPDADPNDGIHLQLADAIPHPRTLKTHLPFSVLHPKLLDTVKVVYVARNPKAVAVSYLHHSRLFLDINFGGSLQQFIDHFIADNLVYGPYWLNLKEAWERRQHPNLHLMFYEDLKADTMGELKRLDTFLGTGLSDDQLKKVAEHTSFGQMKARETGAFDDITNKEVLNTDGGFYRKGESKDWQNKLTKEMEDQMDAWIKEKFNFGVQFK